MLQYASEMENESSMLVVIESRGYKQRDEFIVRVSDMIPRLELVQSMIR